MRSKVLIFGAAGLGLLLLLVVAAVLAVRVGVGREHAPAAATTTTRPSMTGILTLHDPDAGYKYGEVCSGTSGFDDVDAGASVVVTNEQGTVVGTGSLGLGSASPGGDCVFNFTVAGLPPEARFYGVEVSHRGKVTFSREQLEQDRWNVELTLGS
jgi:hypothetical protein